MATLKDLEKYLSEDIDDYGVITSPAYETFQRKYKNYIKEMMSLIGGELVRFMPNHYEFSCFVKRNDKFVYISISDVRYWKNRWWNNILIRTAESEIDYNGGSNDYIELPNLRDKVLVMTR